MFYADMDDSAFIKENSDAMLASASPDAPITPQQIKRIYAIAGNVGLTAQECKSLIAGIGYPSTKKITQSAYDGVCEAIRKKGEE